MQVNQKQDKRLHSMLPIGENEKILGVYRHHWFAYVSIWFVGIFLIIAILGGSIALVTMSTNPDSVIAHNKGIILALALLFSVLVGLFTFIPVWLRSQEQIVLTEEALLQILQPSIMNNKISQLNLLHVADVSVKQDFFGTMFGYGHIAVETPGEQDNYEFSALPYPQQTAKEIIEAHENFQAAVESGRMPTTLGVAPQQAQMPVPQIDPQQYQQFLQYQQMVQQSQQSQAAAAAQPSSPPTTQPPADDASQKDKDAS